MFVVVVVVGWTDQSFRCELFVLLVHCLCGPPPHPFSSLFFTCRLVALTHWPMPSKATTAVWCWCRTTFVSSIKWQKRFGCAKTTKSHRSLATFTSTNCCWNSTCTLRIKNSRNHSNKQVLLFKLKLWSVRVLLLTRVAWQPDVLLLWGHLAVRVAVGHGATRRQFVVIVVKTRHGVGWCWRKVYRWSRVWQHIIFIVWHWNSAIYWFSCARKLQMRVCVFFFQTKIKTKLTRTTNRSDISNRCCLIDIHWLWRFQDIAGCGGAWWRVRCIVVVIVVSCTSHNTHHNNNSNQNTTTTSTNTSSNINPI